MSNKERYGPLITNTNKLVAEQRGAVGVTPRQFSAGVE